jgi:hypothetical protein
VESIEQGIGHRVKGKFGVTDLPCGISPLANTPQAVFNRVANLKERS